MLFHFILTFFILDPKMYFNLLETYVLLFSHSSFISFFYLTEGKPIFQSFGIFLLPHFDIFQTSVVLCKKVSRFINSAGIPSSSQALLFFNESIAIYMCFYYFLLWFLILLQTLGFVPFVLSILIEKKYKNDTTICEDTE